MKKVNFNALNSLTTPDEWLKNALAVPDMQEKKARTPFWQRAVTAAACFIAAAAIGITLLFLPAGRQPIVITLSVPENTTDPVLPTQETVPTDAAVPQPSATASESAADHGEPSRQPAATASVPPRQPPTASAAPSAVPADTGHPASGSQVTQPPYTDCPVTDSTETAYPETAQPTTAQPTTVQPMSEHPVTERPTTEQPVTESSDTEPSVAESTAEPVEPIADVTQSATEPATEAVTEQTYLHTEPSTQAATEPVAEYVYTISRSFYIPENDIVYCKITDLSGEILYGDGDLYSDQHRCQVTGRDKYRTFCSYSPKELGILPEKGSYLCVFYDMYGAVLSTEKVFLNH